MTTEPIEPASLTVEILRELRDEMRLFRREQTGMRSPALATYERTKRLERRLEEVRDDLETAIKMEIMGCLANFESEMEKRLDQPRP